jgi:tetratricopeptide (TPR) repeat protein
VAVHVQRVLAVYRWILALAAACALFAADEEHAALVARAESAFDRVQLARAPGLRDAAGCVQMQAALLAVATPAEEPVAHFRKGWCASAAAALSDDGAGFTPAAAEFDKAAAAWPARAALKTHLGEPMPAVFAVMAAVARLHAGEASEAVRTALAAAPEEPACAGAIRGSACEMAFRVGREWVGWMRLRDGDADSAARAFAGSGGSGWPEWVAGQQAYARRDYRDAAARYRQAIELLHPADPPISRRLGPPPDKAAELAELGGAQLLAGDAAGAIQTLTASIKANAADPRALYRRARARETAGQAEAALADYNLASRTAFANSRDLASGEAHLYRGILLFRRGDYTHAEDEFASALNFSISADARADAVAWRHLSAVAEGSCQASREYLERSLPAASPFFPREEARERMSSCRATGAATAPSRWRL